MELKTNVTKVTPVSVGYEKVKFKQDVSPSKIKIFEIFKDGFWTCVPCKEIKMGQRFRIDDCLYEAAGDATYSEIGRCYGVMAEFKGKV